MIPGGKKKKRGDPHDISLLGGQKSNQISPPKTPSKYQIPTNPEYLIDWTNINLPISNANNAITV